MFILFAASVGKELFLLFAASAFRKLSSIYVFSYFPFGFEGRIWDLIVSVPDHCLSFYFDHEIISSVIPLLPLIQDGLLPVTDGSVRP